jgi:excinuclease UvrABC nuclease subunit
MPANVWRWKNTTDWNYLPQLPGCYIIWLKGKPLYVGQTINLRTRFALHQISFGRVNGREFVGDPKDVSVSYSIGPRESLKRRECDLITQLRPPHNIVGMKGRY